MEKFGELRLVSEQLIARLSGLPADTMDTLLAPQAVQLANELSAARGRIEEQAADCRELLFQFVGATNDTALRKSAIQLSRDLFNGRSLRPNQVLSMPTGISESLRLLDQMKQAEKALCDHLASSFEEELVAARRAVQRWAGLDAFETGVLLSSRTLHQNLERFRNADPRRWSSRLDQIERGLLRYFTRSALKATPFATFCDIVPGRHFSANGEAPGVRIVGDSGAKKRFVRLNRMLFAALWAGLKADAASRQYQAVRLNPTLQNVSGELRFLAIIDGRECFQRINAHPVLPLLFQLLPGTTPVTLQQLEHALAAHDDIEADGDEIREFLSHLLSAGLLTFACPVDEQVIDWDVALARALDGDGSERGRSVRRFLIELRALLNVFTSAESAAERPVALSQIQQLVDGVLADIGFRNVLGGEPVLYADSTSAASVHVSADAGIRNALRRLHELASMVIRVAEPRAAHVTMAHVFKRLYGDETSVPVLTFYEDYYRTHQKAHGEKAANALRGVAIERGYDLLNPFDLAAVSELRAASLALTKLIGRKWAQEPDAREINLTRPDIAGILANISPVATVAQSASVFCQIVPEGPRRPASVIANNAQLLTGFGKFFSRFLYLFSDEFTDAVRQENDALAGGLVLAEIYNNTFFNANIHTTLTRERIDYPTSESATTSGNITVMDLRVEADPNQSGVLRLVHGHTGRQVVPLDLGFLSPTRRPPLFQMLSLFCPIRNSGIVLPETYVGERNAVTPDEPESMSSRPPRSIVSRPRIIYETSVVIGRRRWSIPNELFPYQRPHEPMAQYFARLHCWRLAQGIPEQVYMRVRVENGPRGQRDKELQLMGAVDDEDTPGEIADRDKPEALIEDGDPMNEPSNKEVVPAEPLATRKSRDWHKPQFIDFRSPLLVRLFSMYTGSITDFTAVLEEALPAPGELPIDADGSRRAIELVLQLDLTDHVPTTEFATDTKRSCEH